ncbi:DPP IV N-terminal domain-containing protein [Kitasatospora purpeofusca]|uniref:DPP IV N-terminal domain-containing protein n=1 Tax=Kitasatospora purpeofusca TaxID=67352 RepID=UPI002E0F2DC9|nr:DPP IV N-terminal domain-containing protein [Kitasatospora purpeofusca]WSR38016.1 DPP IV N-terminal domain-containing protein [Kitasatospora purpeofusca]
MITAQDHRAADQLLQCPARPAGPVVDDEVGPQWIDGGARFWFAVGNGSGRRFVLVDPAAGTREPAFDHARLAAALATASGQPVDPEALPLTDVRPTGGAVEFAALGGYWRCRLDDYSCEPAGFTPPGDPPEVLSPDGKVTVTRRGHDLWARSLSDGRQWALTTDGTPDHPYGTDPADPAGTADASRPHGIGLPHLPPAVVWSPDSTRVLTHRTDERGVRQNRPAGARPADGGVAAVPSQRYARAGDGTVAQAELVVLCVDNGTAVRAQADPLLLPQMSPIATKWAWWAEDSSAVYYLARSRTLSLRRLDPETGEVTTVLSEVGDTPVEPDHGPYEPPIVQVLTDEVLWYSERDGRGHLYRYDLHTGALLGQVTSGPWSVRQILRVDEARRVVYFTASGRVEEDPGRRTVCRAALDGPRFGSGSGFGFSFGFGFGLGSGFGSSSGFGFAELTDDELDHAVTVADGQEYFLDSASTVDTPPVTRVRDWTGRVLVELSA